MNKGVSSLSKVLLLLFAGSILFADKSVDSESTPTPPIIAEPLYLNIPHHLWHLSDSWDKGKFILRISADGHVEDWIPLSLPHFELVKSFDQAFAKARFRPASTEAGEFIAFDAIATVPLHGVGGNGVISINVGNYVESRISALTPEMHRLQLATPENVDSPLKIIDKGQPKLPVDKDGDLIQGIVTMEFYVDSEGVPRIIRVVDEPDPRLVEVAIMNIEGVRFNPPRLKGRPTVVRVRMPLEFGLGTQG